MVTRRTGKLKVIPLGGLNEIGKNMTLFECGEEAVIVDCGVSFPEEDMLGIDLVIPDFSYCHEIRNKLKGIVLTHGHEDHIGALPYFLKEINIPIYGTRLTIGLVESKLREHGILNNVGRYCVNAGETIHLGRHFKVEFIHTNHSIADSAALAIKTPVGVVIHSGDFKVDYTPIDGEIINLRRFAELGGEGVLLFMCESTNVELPGYTLSEKSVGAKFDQIFRETPENRIMVATFSSNVHRIQQIMNSAYKYNRKVAVIGRSMSNVVKTAIKLGYMTPPPNTLIDITEIGRYEDNRVVIVMTGSQGETMSALSRIAQNDHKQVDVRTGDKIIISASPIPGNEKAVYRLINDLLKKGAEVIYEGIMDVHVSGHARQEEIKLLHSLVKPEFFVPIHGEFKMLKTHARLAEDLGVNKKNVFVLGLGDVLELDRSRAKITGSVPTGQVFVDGLGVGDVGNIVIRDRRYLSQDGLMIVVVAMERNSGRVVSGPDIISRGFVYVRESEALMEGAREVVREALDMCEDRNITEWTYIKSLIKDTLKDYIWKKTKRSPMILPIIMDIV